ncbi:MAG: hypothetical protein DRP85_04145 [Candidatus Makaraimicrobium thalassicum]|nr:MAG: hypothetical protein DRP85_04145 [Candidatus Omnitrophota bacterium]
MEIALKWAERTLDGQFSVEIGNAYRGYVNRSFQREAAPTSPSATTRTRWAPLMDSTVKKKKRLGVRDPSRVLHETGKLKNSIVIHHHRKTITIAASCLDRYGREYAAIPHTVGGRGFRSRKGQIQRPYLYVPRGFIINFLLKKLQEMGWTGLTLHRYW